VGRVADGVIRRALDAKRARYVMLRLLERARERQVGVPTAHDDGLHQHDHPPEAEPWFPGDEHR